MAEIVITSVQVGRFRLSDFDPAGGSRVYHIKYDIPGMPQLDGHVHTIPAAALANHRIMAAQPDPEVSMDYYLREAMTNIQTHRVLGSVAATTLESSPVVQNTKQWMALVDKVNEEVDVLARTVPVLDVPMEQIQADVQEVVVTPVDALLQPIVTIKSNVRAVATRLGTAQQEFGALEVQTLVPHAVDTSVRAWGTLQGMLADDTEELGTETDAWFESRYGQRIRLTAGHRRRGGIDG